MGNRNAERRQHLRAEPFIFHGRREVQTASNHRFDRELEDVGGRSGSLRNPPLSFVTEQGGLLLCTGQRDPELVFVLCSQRGIPDSGEETGDALFRERAAANCVRLWRRGVWRQEL